VRTRHALTACVCTNLARRARLLFVRTESVFSSVALCPFLRRATPSRSFPTETCRRYHLCMSSLTGRLTGPPETPLCCPCRVGRARNAPSVVRCTASLCAGMVDTYSDMFPILLICYCLAQLSSTPSASCPCSMWASTPVARQWCGFGALCTRTSISTRSASYCDSGHWGF
jgi:hypothetical protein